MLFRSSCIFSSAKLNGTVPMRVQTKIAAEWATVADTSRLGNKTKYICCDISNPAHIEPLAIKTGLFELIDHHFGFEKYWEQQNGVRTDIQVVGACASQVVSRFIAANLKPSEVEAELLSLAILSNTLCLTNALTSKLDLDSLGYLLPEADWQSLGKELFIAVEEEFKKDTLGSLLADCYQKDQYKIAQLEMWDGGWLDHESLFLDIQASNGVTKLINFVSVAEKSSTIYSDNRDVLGYLQTKFDGSLAKNKLMTSNRTVLRKEIFRELENF